MELICKKLKNKNDLEVVLLNLGAAIISVSIPDKDAGRIDLTLGFGEPEDYKSDPFFFGSTPGRYATRIGKGRFTLNGEEYRLPCNEGENHLHGGENGFAQQHWQCSDDSGAVTFTYVSVDGENGYPGTLTANVSYSLNDENELTINYLAESDKDTIINLNNHSYFNLNGGRKPITDHELYINADSFVVADNANIPTGEIRETANTPLDFSSPKRLSDVIFSDYEPIRKEQGIDCCFALNGSGMRRAAVLSYPEAGRSVEVDTDMPGLVVYTANKIPSDTKGRNGLVYEPYSGICLEAQGFPDAPNYPHFPSAVLKKGEVYKRTTIYRFKY